MCSLYEEVEQLKKKLQDAKGKAQGFDKLQRERDQLEADLEDSNRLVKTKDKEIADTAKRLDETKQKLKKLQDSYGSHEDAMAAAEFKAAGLEQDLKRANKEIEELKSLNLQSKLG